MTALAGLTHRARLLLPGVHELITCNDDFVDPRSDVPYLLRTRRPLAVGVQEGRYEAYDDQLGPRWGVVQRDTRPATKGVAVIWDRESAAPFGSAVDDPLRAGRGWARIVDPDPGMDLDTRGVVWRDLKIGSRLLRVASYHRPPWRHRELWPVADARLRAWIDASPLPVVVLGDFNEESGPRPLLARGGLFWRGVRIDGVVATFPVGSASALPSRWSDHRPVSLAVRIPRLT